MALIESGKSEEQVIEAVSILKAADLASTVDEVRRGRWFRDKAAQILKPVKRTLRSISPQRKRRSLLTSE
ncbi:hypothetical protein MMC19_005468 [Ptychographa xylographoides]|nr:hypothetical protein [Ptychographa xylographoides]